MSGPVRTEWVRSACQREMVGGRAGREVGRGRSAAMDGGGVLAFGEREVWGDRALSGPQGALLSPLCRPWTPAVPAPQAEAAGAAATGTCCRLLR